MPITEFWVITPYELYLKLDAFQKQKIELAKDQITLAYLNAQWTIQWLGKPHQRPRPLKEILNTIGKSKEEMTDEQMLEVVKVLNALFGGEVKKCG